MNLMNFIRKELRNVDDEVFHMDFISCNMSHSRHWCLKCEKCAFVFSLMLLGAVYLWLMPTRNLEPVEVSTFGATGVCGNLRRRPLWKEVLAEDFWTPLRATQQQPSVVHTFVCIEHLTSRGQRSLSNAAGRNRVIVWDTHMISDVISSSLFIHDILVHD